MMIETEIPVPAGRYELTEKSTIQFRTRHMFGLGPVGGRFTVKGAAIVVGDSPTESSVTATIDASSFSTRNPLRDVPVRSRLFLDAKRNPTFTFQSDSVSWRDGAWHVLGTLGVRGNRTAVDLTVDQISNSRSGLIVKAHGEVDRYALGLTAFRGMAARNLTFEVEARAVRS
jgi:polyisoprenoid-binding protein YceI